MRKQSKQRLIVKPTVRDLYPGLNEITDALEAFPYDLVGYFTLLKEIDAKCVYTVPYLKAYIERFLVMKKTHPKRDELLGKIRDLIKELMPCLEEKMHVATIASDIVNKHFNRIDQCYEIICEKEIPEIVRTGPLHDPCMKPMEATEVYRRKGDSRTEVMEIRRKEEEDQKAKRAKKHTTTSSNASSGNGYQHHQHQPVGGGNGGSGNGGRVSKKRVVEEEAVKVVPKKSKKRERSMTGETNGAVGGGTTRAVIPEPVPEISQKVASTVASVGASTTIADIATAMAGIGDRKKVNHRRVNSDGEPVYCYCGQVSYGEMVGCDGEDCEREWFHLPCTGLKEPPNGAWYCDECKEKMRLAGRNVNANSNSSVNLRV
ncbi:DEKNAAC105365 [Brettanomyces naardenensis]|uniref:Chromatin modification-related protein n=1 Tax=Brettanomyces naardenensis TaxID=13370 RepID=A0A448YTI5_BRENA|nr:DEKNAAC105365 [Brettanomyces naardenensis]